MPLKHLFFYAQATMVVKIFNITKMKHVYFQNTILIHMAEYFILCRSSTMKWNAKLNIKCQAPTRSSRDTHGKDLWFILGLLDQLCPKYQQTHIHVAVEKQFIFSVLGNLLWDDFKAIYHIAKEEFWGQTNREDRNWREGSQYPSWLDFTSWVCFTWPGTVNPNCNYWPC